MGNIADTYISKYCGKVRYNDSTFQNISRGTWEDLAKDRLFPAANIFSRRAENSTTGESNFGSNDICYVRISTARL